VEPEIIQSTVHDVITTIGNNEEQKEIIARRHKILTWKKPLQQREEKTTNASH
jgi:hypothetical protein